MFVNNRVICEPHERIIVALDEMNEEQARSRVRLLAPHVGGFKVGSELCAVMGDREAIALINDAGKKCLLDRKLFTTPRAMEQTTRVWAGYAPWIFTVHASAGPTGLAAVAKSKQSMLMAGVTVFTSMLEPECRHVFREAPTTRVLRLALDLVDAGADAIMCSRPDLTRLGGEPQFDSLLRVVAGIRPTDANIDDRERYSTAEDAVRNGADYLVIGSAITLDRSPLDAAKRFTDEIGKAPTRA